MDNTQDITCLSLCSGYGGLELGLKRACPNVRTITYVEVEAFACANLVAKMEQEPLKVAHMDGVANSIYKLLNGKEQIKWKDSMQVYGKKK